MSRLQVVAALGALGIVLLVALVLLLARRASARETLMVKMRDGVRLATDVYLPRGQGPWPVILACTPYGKEGAGQEAEAWTERGYAVVAQDMRGRFASEGKDLAFFDCGWGERQDGYDTAVWILQQPWCNGKIGTTGASALGVTQHMLAGAEPPGLVCQHLIVAAPSLYQYGVRPGGVYRETMVDGWLMEEGWDEENLRLMRGNRLYNALWQQVDLLARLPAVKKVPPAVHVGGWFDIFSQGTMDAFARRQQHSGKQWLVMGPWPHGVGERQVGELTFPENAAEMPVVARQDYWFAHWLKGEENGLEEQPAVHYYVMGACGEPGAPGNEWRTAASWPPPAREVPLYLRAAGLLSWEPPASEEAPEEYRHDPANPVPTIGGNNLNLPAGPMDQRPIESRPDVLVLTTAPLKEPLEVTGRVRVRPCFSTTAEDADLMARLCDVYPDGRSLLILDAAQRASHRRGDTELEPVVPGEIYELTIDLWSTSIVFNAGHRIRLVISSSNSPRFETNALPATQRIYHDAQHPSCVLLPVPVR